MARRTLARLGRRSLREVHRFPIRQPHRQHQHPHLPTRPATNGHPLGGDRHLRIRHHPHPATVMHPRHRGHAPRAMQRRPAHTPIHFHSQCNGPPAPPHGEHRRPIRPPQSCIELSVARLLEMSCGPLLTCLSRMMGGIVPKIDTQWVWTAKRSSVKVRVWVMCPEQKGVATSR